MGSLVIVLWAVEVCAFTFCIYYGLTAPWWRHWESAALWVLALDFTVWFALNLANYRWPMPPLAALVGSWAIGMVICASFLTFLIANVHARARANRLQRSSTDSKYPEGN